MKNKFLRATFILILLAGVGSELNAGLYKEPPLGFSERVEQVRIAVLKAKLKRRIDVNFDEGIRDPRSGNCRLDLKERFNQRFNSDKTLVLLIEYLASIKISERLKKFDISLNGLTLLPDGFGLRMRNLRELSFDYNNLTKLPDNFLFGMGSLTELSFRDNPLLQETIDYLSNAARRINNRRSGLLDDSKLRCGVCSAIRITVGEGRILDADFPQRILEERRQTRAMLERHRQRALVEPQRRTMEEMGLVQDVVLSLPISIVVFEVTFNTAFERAHLGIRITEEDKKCPTCFKTLEEMLQDGTQLAITNCYHIFCRGCLEGWLNTATDHRCPTCRQTVTLV
jgi:hypothetical protein